MEQQCLSFAPLYLQGALQLQGILLYLFSFSILFCPVSDDGFLECLALQNRTRVAIAAWKTLSLKCRAVLQASPCPAACQTRAYPDPSARILLLWLSTGPQCRSLPYAPGSSMAAQGQCVSMSLPPPSPLFDLSWIQMANVAHYHHQSKGTGTCRQSEASHGLGIINALILCCKMAVWWCLRQQMVVGKTCAPPG